MSARYEVGVIAYDEDGRPLWEATRTSVVSWGADPEANLLKMAAEILPAARECVDAVAEQAAADGAYMVKEMRKNEEGDR